MKRFFVIVLSVLLSFAVVDVSAQSFLKKLGDAVNKVQQVESQARQVKRTAEQEQQLSNEQFAEQPQQQQQQQQQSQSQMPEQYYEEPAKAYGTHNGHDWVDLGLPSGTMWATVNIGATAEHQAGRHYSWAELKTKSSYSDTNYKYGSADLGDISGNPQYDIAAAEWGGEWRMPTKEEFAELMKFCSRDYVQLEGRWGRMVKSYQNGKSIFLPATGYKEGAETVNASGCGNYWSSTPENTWSASYSYGAAMDALGGHLRYNGLAVRPVLSKASHLKVPASGNTNGHDWVDLGLPSGTKWATVNVGAEHPDQNGLYYYWGELKDASENNHERNKFREKRDAVDITANKKFDVATATWGTVWQIPTLEQFRELKEHCHWQWVTMSGRKGYKVTSKTNGNWIFLIASGCHGSYSGLGANLGDDVDVNGWYWTSSVEKVDHGYTYESMRFLFDERGVDDMAYQRDNGYTIRPVTSGAPMPTQASEMLMTFLGSPIKGNKEKVLEMIASKGFVVKNALNITGDFYGEKVKISTMGSTDNEWISWLRVAPDWNDFKDAPSAKERFRKLYEIYSNDPNYQPDQRNMAIRDSEDVEFMIVENKKKYRARFYEGGDKKKMVLIALTKHPNKNTYGVVINYCNSYFSKTNYDIL